MTYSRHLSRDQKADQMDRRLIRVEFPLAQAGVAAALRRAFQALPVESDDCEGDFAVLLARLN